MFCGSQIQYIVGRIIINKDRRVVEWNDKMLEGYIIKCSDDCGAICCMYDVKLFKSELDRFMDYSENGILKKKGLDCVLLENNKCSVHNSKPLVCKVHPFHLAVSKRGHKTGVFDIYYTSCFADIIKVTGSSPRHEVLKAKELNKDFINFAVKYLEQ